MSIISDALKKAQKERSYIATDTVETIMTSQPDSVINSISKRRERKKRSLFPILLVAFLVIALAAGAALIYKYSSTIGENLAVSRKDQTNLLLSDGLIEAPSVEANLGPQTMDSLPSLTGIMGSPVSPRAIINGIIVSEGDSVNGYQVIKISSANVILKSAKGEINLELR